MKTEEVGQRAGEMSGGLVAMRRAIHAHPEIGFQEHRTASLIEARLTELDIETKRVAGTGVVGALHGSLPGPGVGLRADMDALPISEKNEVPYCSQNPGVMHACGHDAHVACLLGAAAILAPMREQIHGTVSFLFQPAEESDGGALPMIEEGALENPRVDAVFALHVDPDVPLGVVATRDGIVNASADAFDIVVKGAGSHGASPHMGRDALYAACEIVTALQSIVSRNVRPLDSCVVTVGRMTAGEVRNAIADRAELGGTIRAMKESMRTLALARLEEIATGIANTMGCEAEVWIQRGYPGLVTDPAMSELIREVGGELLGAENVHEMPCHMGAEDFAYFAQRIPAGYFLLGTTPPGIAPKAPLHSPSFDIDEASLPIGAAMMAALALRFLEQNRGCAISP